MDVNNKRIGQSQSRIAYVIAMNGTYNTATVFRSDVSNLSQLITVCDRHQESLGIYSELYANL